MKSIHLRRAVVVAAVVLVASSGTARAQDTVRSGLRANVAMTNIVRVPQDPAQPMDPPEDVFRGWGRNVLRIGQDYALKQGESVHDAVVIFSPATIDGYVRGDVFVAFGTVRIGPTAVIDGSLIVVGGNVAVQSGAAVNRDLVVIGGGLDAPTEFNPGGQHIAVGANAIADRLRTVVPWITEGLLLGRPIVPRLGWVWGIVFFVFLASLVLALLFMETVRTCADAIAARPFTTFLTGLLVLLLAGPVSVILAASVVGIAVVPFVLCAVVVAWIIGKLGVAVRLGDRMVGQTPPASRFQSARSFVIGFAAICLIYMVPVLGFIAWALVGVTGLGAAALAFTSAYRRENPASPRSRPRRRHRRHSLPAPSISPPQHHHRCSSLAKHRRALPSPTAYHSPRRTPRRVQRPACSRFRRPASWNERPPLRSTASSSSSSAASSISWTTAPDRSSS